MKDNFRKKEVGHEFQQHCEKHVTQTLEVQGGGSQEQKL